MTTIAPIPEVPVDEDALAEAVRLADGFIAGTNETDAAARQRLIAETWTHDCHFVDPLHEASGHEGLDELYARVHTNFPGYVFHRVGDVERLENKFRFDWEFLGGDGSKLAAGTDFAEIGSDGRLTRITSFYNFLVSS